jgi:uncharacterized protein (DUF433 family)
MKPALTQDRAGIVMNTSNGYQHLERRPGSKYKQLFVKGKKIRADVLYGHTLGEDARTAEELARDYHLPLEVIQEAIMYCIQNPEELQKDRDMEEASTREFESKYPPIVPPDYVSEQ